jgi:hypothetical protein
MITITVLLYHLDGGRTGFLMDKMEFDAGSATS